MSEETLPCHDKLAFDNAAQAEAAAVVAEHEHGAKLLWYQCQHCGLWHLASR